MVIYPIAEIAANLAREEGWSSTVYQDSRGFWTLGYGRNVDPSGPGLTREEGELLLRNDIARTIDELERALDWFTGAPPAIVAALVELGFQLGLPALLRFKKTLMLLEAGLYQDAADELLRSRFADQVPARARRLAERIRRA